MSNRVCTPACRSCRGAGRVVLRRYPVKSGVTDVMPCAEWRRVAEWMLTDRIRVAFVMPDKITLARSQFGRVTVLAR